MQTAEHSPSCGSPSVCQSRAVKVLCENEASSQDLKSPTPSCLKEFTRPKTLERVGVVNLEFLTNKFPICYNGAKQNHGYINL